MALERHTGSLQKLDAQFAEFARQRALSLAGSADWEVTDLPAEPDARALQEWNGQHPNNLVGLRLLAGLLMRERMWQQAKQPLENLINLYPEDISEDSAYRSLARVHRELGETEAERAVLEALVVRDADAVDACRRLIEICEQAEDWAGVAENAERLLDVNPLLRAPHRQLANAAERLGTPARAIQSYRALVRMDPVDPAEAHYRLACLLRDQGNRSSARRQVLMALEEAPRYRAAHRLLLDLVDGDDQPPAAPPDAAGGATASPSHSDSDADAAAESQPSAETAAEPSREESP
jgi:tetratricopeptide (TPR) repeat protein